MAEKNTGTDIIASIENVYAKAPALPTNGKDMLVQVTPWLALVFGILGVIAGLGILGLSPLALFGGVTTAGTVFIGGILTVVSSVLMLLAFPKLQKRAYSGWTLLFWSEVVSIIGTLLSGNIISAVISALIVFYLLFQIKSYYK